MNVTYTGPLDAIEVGGFVVKRGKTIDMPAHVVGRPPDKRVAEAFAELEVAYGKADHEAAKALREELATLDYGEGLLAQPDNWTAAKSTKGGDDS